MNYRVLFIISFLILGLGVAGLFWGPDEPAHKPTPKEISTNGELPINKKVIRSHKVVITTATALKDLKAGQILDSDDYAIKDITITVLDSAKKRPALEAYSLKNIFEQQGEQKIDKNKEGSETQFIHSLKGFVITESIEKGSLINPKSLLAPNDPNFILSSLDSKKEVAFVVPIHFKDAFILKTLKAGDYVSIYSKQSGQDRANEDKNNLVKVLDHILVLQINRPTEEEKEDKNNTTAGNVVLKLPTEQAKELYSLPKEASIMLLPSAKAEETHSKGNFIRNLRG